MYYIAYLTVKKILIDHAYTNIAINEMIDKVPSIDKSLYTLVVKGTVEKMLYLDYWMKPLTTGKRIKPHLKCVLRIILYMLKYTNVANHHIINSMVEIIKKDDYNASRFINAIARQMIDLKEPILQDLAQNEYLMIKYSMPLPIVDLLLEQYHQDTEKIIQALDMTIDNCYRINTLKTSIDNVKKQLNLHDIHFLSETCFTTKTSLINHPLFINGMIVAQSYSSQRVAEIMNPSKDSLILDATSAPGMKSAHLATIMENTGHIVALDIYEHKIKLINENMSNLGVSIVEAKLINALDYTTESLFDQVLIDAPCSGLGVLGGKVDLKYHFTIENMFDIIILQKNLLNHLCSFVKPKGYLTYSTCTINEKENGEQIQLFLKSHDFTIVHEEKLLPTKDHVGFYICKMQKN